MPGISQKKYDLLEDEFIREEYIKDNKPLPMQMRGKYGWYERKRQEFRERMTEQGYYIFPWLK